MWFVIAAMRPASKFDSFEGRVLSRATPLVDFRLPGAEPAYEESVLFVAPPGYDSDIEYDVDLEAEGIGLSPLPCPPAVTDVSARHSTPGGHWLVAPPTLPPDDPRMSGSYSARGWDGENTLTLPVFPLHRRRRRVDASRVAKSVLGSTTPARATRFGLALAALFAVLALKSLGAHAATAQAGHRWLDELTQMGDETPAAVAPAPAVASVPRVVVPARPARPTVIRADAPVWIVMPPTRKEVASPPVLRTADHPLGLPQPTPVPRTEVARL